MVHVKREYRARGDRGKRGRLETGGLVRVGRQRRSRDPILVTQSPLLFKEFRTKATNSSSHFKTFDATRVVALILTALTVNQVCSCGAKQSASSATRKAGTSELA